MVDNILHCDPVVVRTDFTIGTDNILMEDGHFTEAGLMEKEIYKEVRAIVPKFIEDTPKDHDIQHVIDYLLNKKIQIL